MAPPAAQHGSDGGIQWISYLHAKLGRAADSLDLVVKGHRPPLALRLTYVYVYAANPAVQHRHSTRVVRTAVLRSSAAACLFCVRTAVPLLPCHVTHGHEGWRVIGYSGALRRTLGYSWVLWGTGCRSGACSFPHSRSSGRAVRCCRALRCCRVVQYPEYAATQVHPNDVAPVSQQGHHGAAVGANVCADWAHPCPHLRRDWAHPCHSFATTGRAAAIFCAGIGLIPVTSAPGLTGLVRAPMAPLWVRSSAPLPLPQIANRCVRFCQSLPQICVIRTSSCGSSEGCASSSGLVHSHCNASMHRPL